MDNKLVSIIFLVSLFCTFNCSHGSSDLHSQEAVCKNPDLLGYVFARHWDCDSFLIRYSPYKNLVGVLMIDKHNNGYILEIFNIFNKQKVFDFQPVTVPISDFRLNENNVIVSFSDAYGMQIAYDVYTGEILWQTQ